MNILVLNGSPRANGNTAFLVDAFKAGAESNGNTVSVISVGTKNIVGCTGCNYCRQSSTGTCCQIDDMPEVYQAVKKADMIVFASPVYYWTLTSQLQATITRFYALGIPSVKKYAMILSSGSPNVYDAIEAQYRSILSFFGAQDCGIRTAYGENNKSDAAAEQMRAFGASL